MMTASAIGCGCRSNFYGKLTVVRRPSSWLTADRPSDAVSDRDVRDRPVATVNLVSTPGGGPPPGEPAAGQPPRRAQRLLPGEAVPPAPVPPGEERRYRETPGQEGPAEAEPSPPTNHYRRKPTTGFHRTRGLACPLLQAPTALQAPSPGGVTNPSRHHDSGGRSERAAVWNWQAASRGGRAVTLGYYLSLVDNDR
jgi:hypothetical protein